LFRADDVAFYAIPDIMFPAYRFQRFSRLCSGLVIRLSPTVPALKRWAKLFRASGAASRWFPNSSLSRFVGYRNLAI